MKIKKSIILAVLTLFTSIGVSAQDGAGDDCAKFRSLYFQYIPQTTTDDESMRKQYRDAANFWAQAITACGMENLDAKFFYNGKYIYNNLVKYTEDSVQLKNFNDTIVFCFESRMKVENDPSWTADYATYLVGQGSTDYDKIDQLYKESIHKLKSESSATDIMYYFKHLIMNKFNSAKGDEKEVARTEVIDEYIVLSEYVSEAHKKAKAEANENSVARSAQARDYLDKYFLLIAKDCDILTEVFAKKLATLPQEKAEKLAKVNSYLGLMDQKQCQSTAVYGQFVDTLILLEPTADAYYFGASYASSNGNSSKAFKYYEKAVEMEGDGPNKDKYLLSLANAQYKAGSYKSAYNTAKKINGDEFKGDALLICANVIAATANDCGDTTFDRKANNWLANDYVNRAISAGASASSGKFLDRAPDTGDIFEAGKAKGGSHLCACWGESTTIR
ncbi:tetratricopeptide repeat protein [Crocinitomix catalasitica]|uniref:tetratricopeptide repeat protein n=1 Tax=Crocinitomix catalasitica TaxID=184607 RepID=UPI0012F8AAD3|nr:hypothetical protein [Crocinitomix catalasitica]